MFTRGSRLFFGLATASLLGAMLYGIITNGLQSGGVIETLTGKGAVDAVLGPITLGYKGGVGDHIGFSLLLAFAVCSLAIGIGSSAFRDGDPEAIAELANLDAVPPVSEPNDLSAWPLVAAFGATAFTIGLAVGPALTVIGVAALVIAAVQWTVQAWSERATGDPAVNRAIRSRLMGPLELPVGAVVIIGAVVFCLSRVLLTVSKEGAIIVGSVVGLLFFTVGVVLSKAPELRRSVVVVTLLGLGTLVLALGIFGAANGERTIEKHHEEHALSAPAAPTGA